MCALSDATFPRNVSAGPVHPPRDVRTDSVSHLPIAEALAEAARQINSSEDLDSVLGAIVRSAARSLPGVDHVGISIAHRGGQVETRAGTDQLVWELDALQYDLHEGPCAYAIDVEPVVIANHLRHEQRWPRYVPHAIRMGVQAQMGLRLFIEDQTLGGLNVYATTTDTIDPDVAHAGQMFAAHSALALGRARRESQLTEAISSRQAIGQALGLVMERYRIDEDRSFQFLVRVSSTSNTKLRDVAAKLVTRANLEYAVPSPGV